MLEKSAKKSPLKLSSDEMGRGGDGAELQRISGSEALAR